MPRAYLCDFDGTVSPLDIGAAFMRRFSSLGEAEALGWIERWRAGEIGSRELTAFECAALTVDAAEALGFARQFQLDPEFAPFVREARARGERVFVVSDGLDFYVRDQLDRVGLDVPWTANRSRFEGGRVWVDFDSPAGCGRCGNCKAAHVERHRALGYEVVMVGDGLSDRCGARVADRVVARGELGQWCDREGIPAIPFRGFADVRRVAGAWAVQEAET
jgi:HAD superfamily phosphoserine phosphatase-like hydrolase